MLFSRSGHYCVSTALVAFSVLSIRCSSQDRPEQSCNDTLKQMTESRTFYRLTRMTPHFGAFVHGLDLSESIPLSAEVIEQIKEDIKTHRLLVFKNQQLITGEKQVELTKQLGTIESTFYKHPRSPHPDIFRVSNLEEEGCTGVGTTGWHIDGTFQAMPFKYQTMHFHGVCEGGDTWFVPLNEFFERQDEATKQRWDRLWMLSGKGGYAHPLVYRHPTRGDTTMMLHCGAPFCAGWAVDEGGGSPAPGARHAGAGGATLPAAEVQGELSARLDAAVETLGVKMRWAVGDLAINDNLANAHLAPPGTQAPRALGVRILHRTTVAGESVPTKADGRRSFLLS